MLALYFNSNSGIMLRLLRAPRLTVLHRLIEAAFTTKRTGRQSKEYHIRGQGESTRTNVYVHDSKDRRVISTDVPVAMGGKNSAPQPVEMLLASLCGCEQVTAEFVARHAKPRMYINKIEFEVFAKRDSKAAITLPLDVPLPPARLERVWGTATVHTSADQEQVDMLSREIKRRCPIANMVELSGCELDIVYIKYENQDSNPTR